MAIPKVAAIHDLSGLGKCSLTAAIPILSVCGVQAVPLATAVLSNQTAFESYTGVDLSEYLPMIAAEWKKRKLSLIIRIKCNMIITVKNAVDIGSEIVYLTITFPSYENMNNNK